MTEAVVVGTRLDRAARFISDVFAPWSLAVVMPPLVGGMTTTPVWRGVVAGCVVSVLGGLVPGLLIWRGVRAGQYEDRFVGRREQRPRLLAAVVALVTLSLVIVYFLGAPSTLLAMTALMILMAAVAAAVSRWWKMSVHALLAGASIAVLVTLHGELFPIVVVLPVVLWARRRVRAHSTAQLVVGAAVGVAFGYVAGRL